VVRALARRILEGELLPGTALPSETLLCGALGVGRSSVREAVRVLASKGLVEARPRTGTRVRPREAWSRLDPELLEWSADLEPDLDFVAGLIEARRIIEPAAAELAAARASGRDLANVETAYECRDLAHDLDACCEADLAFHTAILRASHNPVLAQLASIIGTALRSSFRLTTSLSHSYQRTLKAHGDVLEAIRLRDAERARAAMLGLIDVAAADLQLAQPGGAVS
jgi:GntR family transcriptional regulator, galactonate operon transcriptional repressor